MTRKPTLRITIWDIVARCAAGSAMRPAMYMTYGGPPMPNRAPSTPPTEPAAAAHHRLKRRVLSPRKNTWSA
jgi:hypothetical protein